MKQIIAKVDFVFNGVPYEKGNHVEINNSTQAAKLNELGYIEPLTIKDIYEIKLELENSKKEEE